MKVVFTGKTERKYVSIEDVAIGAVFVSEAGAPYILARGMPDADIGSVKTVSLIDGRIFHFGFGVQVEPRNAKLVIEGFDPDGGSR